MRRSQHPTANQAATLIELTIALGVMATVEWPIGWQLRLGGRLGYQQATGVDSEESYVGIDADLWARFVFIPGQLEVFAAGALGVSTLTVNDSIAGRGLHAMVGAGAGYPLSPTLRALAGVYYDHRAGDPQREVSDATNELKDVKLSRVLLTAGLAF